MAVACLLPACSGTTFFSSLTEGQSVLVEIPEKAGTSTIAQNLFEKNIISSPRRFKLYVRITGQHQKLKAGEYLFNGPKTDQQIVAMLVQGQVYRHKITFPEGWTVKQIAALLEREGLVSAADFMLQANDADKIRSLILPQFQIDKTRVVSAEGFLFPSTYFFPKKTKPETMIQEMIKNFNQAFSPAWIARMQEISMTLNQTVTLASIVEKETGAAFERPMISSVYHNRLKIGMRLQSDPTTIYGIRDFNGNLTRKDLEAATPYNTYVIKGLPPGPIANPGRDAIAATLYPESTKFLYFVSKNNGTHFFSENYRDHNRAVDQYQRRRQR